MNRFCLKLNLNARLTIRIIKYLLSNFIENSRKGLIVKQDLKTVAKDFKSFAKIDFNLMYTTKLCTSKYGCWNFAKILFYIQFCLPKKLYIYIYIYIYIYSQSKYICIYKFLKSISLFIQKKTKIQWNFFNQWFSVVKSGLPLASEIA